eukprot:scaffold26947_cov30-Phaeocystis_antarctica.AAC.1
MHLALLASLGRSGLSEHMLRLEDVTAVHTREVRASRGWGTVGAGARSGTVSRCLEMCLLQPPPCGGVNPGAGEPWRSDRQTVITAGAGRKKGWSSRGAGARAWRAWGARVRLGEHEGEGAGKCHAAAVCAAVISAASAASAVPDSLVVETDTPVKRKDCRSGVDRVGTSVVGTAATQLRRKLWSSSEEVVIA